MKFKRKLLTHSASQHNKQYISDVCTRFCHFVEQDLRMSYKSVAQALGYANASPLTRVRKGEGFIEIERLARLSELAKTRGISLDLNWLILGITPEVTSSSINLPDSAILKLREFIQAIHIETLKQDPHI